MVIDDKLIAYLEELSCLTLTDEEKIRLAGDLEKILGGMSRLDELDVAGVPERSHPFDDTNAFREDEAAASFDRELILKNAPRSDGGFIIAPKTVE